ncbi:major facilitator superfamily domain-containing protein [Bombardia bombarda]|uniref:Major facilitator superfamily domain-containing protein n=1 Tax=Bombardia bombarda TaxID=252184 RepID=A0AA39WMM7_9PEZI|nr:major facilitator superfamily domain-containing protein [Bombardia bombarda]
MTSSNPGNDTDDTGVSTLKEEPPSPGTEPGANKDVAEVSNGHHNNNQIFKPTRDFYLAFLALCTIGLATAFDATSLSVALPIISTELGGTALEAFWSGTSFLLASTVLQPSIASLSNIFGRKYMLYVTGVFFAAGSLIAALAGNFTIILVGRTLQGIGGGGLAALTEIVITDLVPLAIRGQWMSLLSATWSVGTVTGPLIGAGFAQNVTWRWIFYINLPIIAIGMVFVVFFLHQAEIPGGICQKLGRFDYFGSALFTASMTAFLFGLTTGGVMYEWASYQVLVPLLVGPAGLVVFMYYEFNYAAVPIINRRIFNNWDIVASYIMTVFHGMILWSFAVLPSREILLARRLCGCRTPRDVDRGARRYSCRRSRGQDWPLSLVSLGGWMLTTLGAGILLLMGPTTTVAQWIFLNIPIGLGTGMCFPAMALSIQASCDPDLNGQATAFFTFLRGLGEGVGVAISGVIFQNVFKQKLMALPTYAAVADEFSRDATIVIGVINAMPDGVDRADLVQAFSDSLRMIWASLIVYAGICLVLSFTLKGHSLTQEHVTEQRHVSRAEVREVREEKRRSAAALSAINV